MELYDDDEGGGEDSDYAIDIEDDEELEESMSSVNGDESITVLNV